MEAHQAFAVGENAWGLQFHPEFDAATVACCIEESRDVLTQRGRNPDSLLETCVDTGVGHEILRRFSAVASGR
jgi:GMP synthase (glutamine-hydrolysing)